MIWKRLIGSTFAGAFGLVVDGSAQHSSSAAGGVALVVTSGRAGDTASGGIGEILRIIKFNRADIPDEVARTYLRRFNLEHSLAHAEQEKSLKDCFTQPVSPFKLDTPARRCECSRCAWHDPVYASKSGPYIPRICAARHHGAPYAS